MCIRDRDRAAARWRGGGRGTDDRSCGAATVGSLLGRARTRQYAAQRLACEETAWLLNRMRCDLSPRQLAVGLAAVTLLSSAAARAVSIGVSSATVAQPGSSAQVCVSLVPGGEEVAGTQKDLVWDRTCMTLNDNGCAAAGAHPLSFRVMHV